MSPDPDGLRQPESPTSHAALREACRTVLAFFHRRVGDGHAAHDLTQTTFLRFRVWQDRNPGLMPDNLGAFLLQQAEWVRRDHFRRTAKTRATETLSGSPSDLEALEDGRLLAAAASGSSLSAVPEHVDLGRAVASLSATKRLALVLRFVDGLPASQIADVLAVSPRRVNQLIRETLDELACSEPLSGYSTLKGGHR